MMEMTVYPDGYIHVSLQLSFGISGEHCMLHASNIMFKYYPTTVKRIVGDRQRVRELEKDGGV